MATNAEEGSPQEDKYSDPAGQFGGLKLPNLNTNIDLRTVAPAMGVQGGNNEPEYLNYDVKERDLFAKSTYNCGASYVAGIALGGLYGIQEGRRKAPSGKFRVVLNSVMNSSGKRGSRLGNSGGILALFYTCAEHVLDANEVDRFFGEAEFANPCIAATLSGLMFKSTAGLKPAALGGAAGFGLMATYYGVRAGFANSAGGRR